MSETGLDLALIWALILGFAIITYVVLDGFDLGLGILFPLIRDPGQRELMMNSVAPVWDGNETWLVLGGGGLFAAFPLAYGVILPALYAPVIAMLLALIFRGVAFEFRFRDPAHRPVWDLSFTLGSMTATFAQGVVLGAFVQGIEIAGRGYGGGWFDWLTPFSLFTGLALMAGYALLGAAWLVMKTEGDLRDRCYRLIPRLGAAVIAAIAGVSLWTPLLDPRIAERWFSLPNLFYLSSVPVLVAVCLAGLVHGVRKRRDSQPFLFALGLFLLSYLGLGISLYPFIVPFEITIAQAAAPDSSLSFMLAGAAVLIPLVLSYTAYGYWVFRGKVRPGEGYH